ncbi:hypothetical protein ACFPRL_23515 [Pseudoclavibacter helvolus]
MPAENTARSPRRLSGRARPLTRVAVQSPSSKWLTSLGASTAICSSPRRRSGAV